MKKIITISILCLAMLSIVACSKKNKSNQKNDKTSEQITTTAEPTSKEDQEENNTTTEEVTTEKATTEETTTEKTTTEKTTTEKTTTEKVTDTTLKEPETSTKKETTTEASTTEKVVNATSFTKKIGKWTARYDTKHEKTTLTLTIVAEAGKSSLEAEGLVNIDDLSIDPNLVRDELIDIDGELYFAVPGLGGYIKSISEKNNKITMTDELGGTCEFIRVDENTIKCVACSEYFCDSYTILVDTVFTFSK